MKVRQRHQNMLDGNVSARIAHVFGLPGNRHPIKVDTWCLQGHDEANDFDPPDTQMLHSGQLVEGQHRRLDAGLLLSTFWQIANNPILRISLAKC